MTTADLPESSTNPADRGAEQQPNWLTVSTEQLYVDTQWIVSGRVRLRRKIETRTETIQVTLRREVLVIDTDSTVGADGVYIGVATDGPAIIAPEQPPEPISMVLREEVPEISVTVQPYQRVNAEISRSSRRHPVTATARHEQIEVDALPPGGLPG